MVECEIIPRLVRAHPIAIAVEDGVAEPELPLDAKAAQAFARVVLSRNPDTLDVFVEKLRARGVGSERLYADLLAPAARLLADLWDQDEISFTEVTIGLGRLQHVVRDLESGTAYNGDNDPAARSCLFSPRPGEQQTFGFYMIEELFRWSGWRTWIETAATDAEMVADVRCQWFDMFCLSVSRSANIQDVAATIEAVRRASRNRELFILVNGRPFIERPELVATVGADAAASCGREALHIADKAVWRLATA
jgi:methanogenic corrinoid protein MtbC1